MILNFYDFSSEVIQNFWNSLIRRQNGCDCITRFFDLRIAARMSVQFERDVLTKFIHPVFIRLNNLIIDSTYNTYACVSLNKVYYV